MEKEKNGDLFGLFPKVVCRFNYEKDINKEIEFIKNNHKDYCINKKVFWTF